MDWAWPVIWIVSGALSVLLFWLAQSGGGPMAGIGARWSRWFFMAGMLAWIFGNSVLAGYPAPVVFVVSALVWFLVESMFIQFAVGALSRSDLPLFPRFRESESQEIWPNDRRLLRLRDAIRRHEFKRVQTLVSEVNEQIVIRAALFRNNARTIELTVYFIPALRARLSVVLALQSETRDGRRVVTDNVSLPFGGFYPEDWFVERRPLMRRFEQLLNRHLARLDAWGEDLAPLDGLPLDRLNNDQARIERLNRELGFLNGPAEEEEEGRLTSPARYRVWKEIWTLGYLGRSRRY